MVNSVNCAIEKYLPQCDKFRVELFIQRSAASGARTLDDDDDDDDVGDVVKLTR